MALSQRARFVQRKGVDNRKDLEMRRAMEGIRKSWAWMQKLNEEYLVPIKKYRSQLIEDPTPGVDYNTVWIWNPIRQRNEHTYNPDCPQGCVGHQDDCAFLSGGLQDG